MTDKPRHTGKEYSPNEQHVRQTDRTSGKNDIYGENGSEIVLYILYTDIDRVNGEGNARNGEYL